MVKLKPKPQRLEKDCLDCKKYLTCNDPSKAVNFVCRKFRERTTVELADVFSFGGDAFDDEIDMSDVEGEKAKKESSTFLDLDKKINVSELINSVLTSDLLTPVDTKIDDSSVPMAKNFYEFTTGQKFLGVKPYLFQMLYITQLFSEYCPRCSDTAWMKSGAKVNDSLSFFKSKVSCLEHGLCPKCGATKTELVKSGELNYYQELAGLAGQRCVTDDTIVHTDKGMQFVGDLKPDNAQTGFNDISDCSVVTPLFRKSEARKFYVSEPEQVITVFLENGMSITGTKEHPIKTRMGYMPLAALPYHVEIPIRFDYEGYGNIRLTSDQAHSYGYMLACREGNTLQMQSPKDFRRLMNHYQGAICVETLDGGYTLPDSAPSNEDILRTIMQTDRSSLILVLRAFFIAQKPQYVSVETKRVVMLSLQMLGIAAYYTADGFIMIDGDYRQAAVMLFGINIGQGELIYRGFKYDKESNVYYVPVKGVEWSKEKYETYDFVVPGVESFIANGIDNHNSGKSAIVAMCCAYLVHKNLKMQKPNEIYGLLPANVLHGTFVALTYKQAAETLWEPFLAYITDSPWFCVEENTLVALADGSTKPIKDVKIGDLVKTYEGQSEVTKVYDNGVKECFRLTTSNGAAIEATAEHKFCRVVEGDRQWVPLEQLSIGDSIVVA